MSRRAKPKRGRPLIHGKRGARYNVYLPAHVVAYLKRIGKGSLSLGITTLVPPAAI
jgi:hypothetical protein